MQRCWFLLRHLRPGNHLRQCLRSHSTNGLLSMLGNLNLVAVLLRTTHLPLLAANILAIAACSLGNFYLGNLWVFTARPTLPLQPNLRAKRL